MSKRRVTSIGVLALISGFRLMAQDGAGANAPAKPKGPWMDSSLSPDKRADLVVGQMTFDEKIQMVHGAGLNGFGPTDPSIVRSNGGGGFVPGIERLGLPDLNMDDSSVGVGGGAAKGRYSTALPSTLALASSWDLELAHEYGALIGRELADQGYNVSLAGGVDITREARNGRNFEYQGEDPILAGNIDAQLIHGVQSQGIIGDIKHYALNDSETGRYFSNSILDKRSMRETDLLAFEIGVKKGKPGMVMCSYNLINGVYACENDYTLNQVLKKEWGFEGWVISDWFGTHSTVKAALGGLDQEQPGREFFGDDLKRAVDSGTVPTARLNDMVHRILRTEFASGIVDHPPVPRVPDVFAGLVVARKAAEESSVLLKNAGGLLPLDAARLKSIAVIGSHADIAVLSGSGSAQVAPAGGNPVPDTPIQDPLEAMFLSKTWHRSSPLRAIRGHVPGAQVIYDSGDDPAAAARVAAAAEVAIVFVNQHASEGRDAVSLSLPGAQDELVKAVAGANPRTVVVLETGGPVSMPWSVNVNAILEAWYPGISGGEAIANLLFGDANPSGKLAVTFAKSDADLPHPVQAGPPGPRPGPLEGITTKREVFDVSYNEGLKVGYKWFDAEGKAPLFPFGFGLSYTRFEYSGLSVTGGPSPVVSVTVRNVGKRAGADVVQVYAALPEGTGEPPKRLVGWARVTLAPGESKPVQITVEPLYMSIFDEKTDGWRIAAGEYKFQVGSSSRDLALSQTLRLD